MTRQNSRKIFFFARETGVRNLAFKILTINNSKKGYLHGAEPSSEANSSSDSQIPCIFWKPKIPYRVHIPPLVPFLREINLIHAIIYSLF